MCGRYTLARSEQELSERFGIKQIFFDLSPRYNIAPGQKTAVIFKQDGELRLEEFKWGLIPSWLKDLQKAKALINARAETLFEKPSFRSSIAKRRCLIPADGFYEWRLEGNTKVPMYIQRADRAVFAFAGIFDEWKAQDETVLRTFSIITTQANEFILPVHERMPVILPPEAEERWLDPSLRSAPELLPLLRPCPDDLLNMYAVSTKVNSTKQDSKELIEEREKQLRLLDI